MWRSVVLACVVFALLVFGEHQALAQTRDSLLNGAVFGAVQASGRASVLMRCSIAHRQVRKQHRREC